MGWQILAVAITTLIATPVFADGKFQVDPTRVDLGASAQTGAVHVTNHGAHPIRLQITAVAWTDDADGVMQLAPTSDIVVRPSLIEIAPGARSTLRVGVTVSPRAAEQSYRLFVEELPDRRPKPAGRIDVLTRIGIPIFVAPRTIREAISVGATANVVTVANAGTTHVKLRTVRLAAHRDSKRRWQREVTGWYVLPSAARRFVVPGTACEPGDELVAEVVAETGATWSARGRCGP
jgi:fimbrial chaperone protein